MRRYYRKHSTYRDSDLTLKYLGYWTDNGRKHLAHADLNMMKCFSERHVENIIFVKLIPYTLPMSFSSHKLFNISIVSCLSN